MKNVVMTKFFMLLGSMVSVWCLLSSYRLLMGGILLTAFFCLKGRKSFEGFVAFRDWCRQHSVAAFLSVVFVGIVIRLIVCLLSGWYGVDDLWAQAPDYRWIWNESVQFSHGVMPPTKSWTSVWLYGVAFGFCGNSLWTAYILSTALLVLSAWCGYKMLRHYDLPIGASLFAFLFFNSPVMVMHSWCVATEQVFVAFMMVALMITVEIDDAKSDWASVLLTGLLGVALWLSLWSRGEGLLLWLVLPIMVGGKAIFERRWKKAILIAIPLAVVLVCGYVLANGLNRHLYGTGGAIPGNTREWNKLFGANVTHGGCYCHKDIENVVGEYRRLHPECDWDITEPFDGKSFSMGVGLQTGAIMPKELIPLAKRETVRRWKAMSWGGVMKLILVKERRWAQDYRAGASGGWLKDHLQAAWQGLFSGVMCLLAIWLFSRGLLKCSPSVRRLCVVCLILVIGNMAIHVVTETGERHAWMQYVLFPMLAAVASEVILKEMET